MKKESKCSGEPNYQEDEQNLIHISIIYQQGVICIFRYENKSINCYCKALATTLPKSLVWQCPHKIGYTRHHKFQIGESINEAL